MNTPSSSPTDQALNQLTKRIKSCLQQMVGMKLDLISEDSQKISKDMIRRVQAIRHLMSRHHIQLESSFCSDLVGQINNQYKLRNISETGVEKLAYFLIDCVVSCSSTKEASTLLHKSVKKYSKNDKLHTNLYNYVLACLVERAKPQTKIQAAYSFDLPIDQLLLKRGLRKAKEKC